MTHKPKPSPSQTLLQSTLQPTGEPGQFDMVIVKAQQVEVGPITTLERIWLERKHGSRNIHPTRPYLVKFYWHNGFSARDIAALLRGQKGCGKRQIEKDLAALSEATPNFEKP